MTRTSNPFDPDKYSDEESDRRLEAYFAEADAFMMAFEAFVTKNYGARCRDVEDGCPCCRMWRWFDEIGEYVK